MKLDKWISSTALAAVLALAGCNATKARINDNEDLFRSYSPEIQSAIRSNRIQRGFDSTQTYLALGNADRTEYENDQELWYYYQTHTRTQKEEKSAGEYRDEMTAYENALEKGYTHVQEPTTYRVFQLRRTSVQRIVRFENGVVVDWEEPESAWVDDWHR